MLDVHAPHESIHTWKSFFIHIATISVGLLIAIGLEQTVEAIHRHHQYRKLDLELHNEALDNKKRAEGDILWMDRQLAWLLRVKDAVETARRGHGANSVLLPRKPPLPVGALHDRDPVLVAWNTAMQSGGIALLPHEEALRYSLSYSMAEQELRGDALTIQAVDEFQSLFIGMSGAPNDIYLTGLSEGQLQDISRSASRLFTTLRHQKVFWLLFYSANECTLRPDLSQKGCDTLLATAMKTYPDPDGGLTGPEFYYD